MSVQAGVWNFDGAPVSGEWLKDVSSAMALHGPDGESFYQENGIGIVYRPFHTTAEGRQELQPWISQCGNVIVWDGRLDNAEDLRRETGRPVCSLTSEAALVLEAFERWGFQGLEKLRGDFALSIWQPKIRKLVLARDCFASRPLFYQVSEKRVMWSTDLASLVSQHGARWTLDDSYIAGYLVAYPEPEETPYREIRGVGAAGWIEVTPGRVRSGRFWQLDPGKRKDQCKTDADYEESFRHFFRQSVRRRIRTNAPILAQLSGGMDSSSIVCMADDILKVEPGLAPRIDTVTHFDECEPTGDEREWAKFVEQKRGRAGAHLNTAEFGGLDPTPPACFLPVPGLFANALRLHQAYENLMRSAGCRVILSGIGGDEFTGGVPDPYPQLGDRLLLGRWITLARLLKQWSLAKKRPLLGLLWTTLMRTGPANKRAKIDTWINPQFAASQRLAGRGLSAPRKTGRLLPTRRAAISTLHALAGLNSGPLLPVAACEIRRPFQDRDLVEFLTSIPDEQLLRPGRRRSLLRRALAGFVPAEIFERKRKAAVVRRPMIELAGCVGRLDEELQVARMGYADPEPLKEALRLASGSAPTNLIGLMRLLALESWLRNLDSSFAGSLGGQVDSVVGRQMPAASAG